MNFINNHLAGLKKGKHKLNQIIIVSTFPKWSSQISIIPKNKSKNKLETSNMPCPTPPSIKNIIHASETIFKKSYSFSLATSLKATKVKWK